MKGHNSMDNLHGHCRGGGGGVKGPPVVADAESESILATEAAAHAAAVYRLLKLVVCA